MTLPPYTIWPYDCVDAMLHLIDEGSVHCVVTSPPYFGLRDYDHPGQIGHEESPAEYVARLVEVGRAIRRVLRDDGTFWLNLGDSYANDRKGRKGADKSTLSGGGDWQLTASPRNLPVRRYREWGLKRKDLIGIPWRVAFALQADGWYLRQDIIWHKRNPMPQSVRDRFTPAHEYLFLFSKSQNYFFDQEAVKEPATRGWRGSKFHTGQTAKHQLGRASSAVRDTERIVGPAATRIRRDVWTLSSQPFKGGHYAAFPPDLVEPCVLAGSPTSCCSRCGAPRVAKVERVRMVIARSGRGAAMGEHGRTCSSGQMLSPASSRVVAYNPTCKCEAPDAPAVVLDPFGGTGTTGVVARRHGRSATLCEINPDFVVMAYERIESGR